MRIILLCLFAGIFCITISCKKNPDVPSSSILQLQEISIGSVVLSLIQQASNTNVPTDQPLNIFFNVELESSLIYEHIKLTAGGVDVPLTFYFATGYMPIIADPVSPLDFNQNYVLEINDGLQGANGETFSGISVSFTTEKGKVNILSISVSGKNLLDTAPATDVDRNFPAVIKFDHPIDAASLSSNTIKVLGAGMNASIAYALSDSGKTLNIQAIQPLVHFAKYTLVLSADLKGKDGFIFSGFSGIFYTALDTLPKFPIIPDDDLLTLVEQQTFNYFWDFAHPASGLARERNTSGNTVTVGGSGFGVMAIIVGISRNFISRQEGVDRLEKIVDFLTDADRFHGVWPHWMNGSTGDAIPFSSNDNGADLVETSYMIQGLLTVRQFLDPGNSQENALITKINNLWHTVEWDWFTKGGQNVLYWHWSPDKGWIMNMQVKGYNEALITYVMAAASPTHTIDASVYHSGWASNGGIQNGNSYYGFPLPVGGAYGGPLFFAHYSFLGFDPNNLKDDYADYWEQNVNHTQINRAYCIDNPKNYVGYSSSCWGLTASDNQSGYNAHSPTNDLGVISPTAALSSFPYTPESSMEAMKFFYYTIGDKLWGPYGFYDAFNVTEGWYGTSALAIDQGPIIVMMENYRTGLLWDLFMSNPEVDVAMDKLGFTN